MSTIVLDGVSKVFAGGVHAVREIDLTIPSGEFIAPKAAKDERR